MEELLFVIAIIIIFAGGMWGQKRFNKQIYKICPSCKKTIDRDSNFCKFCGKETPNAKLER